MRSYIDEYSGMQCNDSGHLGYNLFDSFICSICKRPRTCVILPYEEHGPEVSARDWNVGATFVANGSVELVCPDCYRFGETYAENGLPGASRFSVNYDIDPLQLLFDELAKIKNFGFDRFDLLRRKFGLEFKSFGKTERDFNGKFLVFDFEKIFDIEASDVEYRGWILEVDFDYELGPRVKYSIRIGEASEESKKKYEFIRPANVSYTRSAAKIVHHEVISAARCFLNVMESALYRMDEDLEAIQDRYRREFLNIER